MKTRSHQRRDPAFVLGEQFAELVRHPGAWLKERPSDRPVIEATLRTVVFGGTVRLSTDAAPVYCDPLPDEMRESLFKVIAERLALTK